MTAPAHLVAQVSSGWHPARDIGDVDPLLSDAKTFLKRFSYGKAEGLGITDVDDTYTEGYGRAQAKFKAAVRQLVQAGQRPGPITDLDAEFDWATKSQMQLLAPPPPAPVDGRKLKPLYISVEGHMSDMFIGPAVGVGQQMEAEGLVQLQPTGYVNTAIPFQSNTGVSEVCRFMLDPVLMPAGRPWCISGFSEGDIVVSRFLNRHVINPTGQFHHRLRDLVSVLEMGAPYRPKDFLGDAVLQPDSPKAGTGGISPEWLQVEALGDRIAYLVRHGDMYTETPFDKAGQMQRSIYSLIAASDPKALLFELVAVGINPTAEIMNVVNAILRGVLFLGNMTPHGGYQLGPAIDWVRGKIKASVSA
ncbi:hypothetical protein [Mycolicibacterium fluoranthenivorans]|uniref:Uncharacterized protein n=1 Tax=Mycolicibacterium fluoranthenivorans TaxID=258505 RepID=A0A7X5ZG35_9MYCO|nr:hypothetical protein [Mycolicibacterium fluoranthenivorans]MCV7354513.1 hypothetical protein [Mycolicibacterium fluoranthenivorans]NIH98879.1 hypothetical protein [Mycolicibacterium fluoranthenivorans]